VRYDGELSGYGIELRPVEVTDAAAIVELRCTPENRRFIGETDPDPAKQERWIADQLERPGDYYFAVVNAETRRFLGTISAYDIDEDTSRCEWGRWILAAGSGAAPASVVLILEFVFGVLDLAGCYTRTVSANAQVVSLHDSFGAVRAAGPAEPITIFGAEHTLVRHTLDRAAWDRARPRAVRIAHGAQRFLT